jgi:mRNA interferase YafQ
MRQTKYTVKFTTQFKKDYKLAIKRGLEIGLLEEVVSLLSMGKALPEKNEENTMRYQEIGLGTGNATFSRTGFLSTALMMKFWC